jgi:glycosyltransferase involved in cell wall biosynthesis
MRILQVSPFFSPQLGGSPQVVYQISRELSKRGHSVTVLAGNYGINKASFPNETFNTIILPSVISRWGFYFTPGMLPWCERHIGEFDVIHLHEARTFQNIIVRWYATRSKIPYVLSAHGTLPLIVQRQLLKKAFDVLIGKSILESARYLIAVSPYEAEQYRQAGVDDSRIRVIYNGLNLDEFANLPTRGTFRKTIPGLVENTSIILYLGRLHRRKGINFLIEALSYLQNNLGKILLVIVGPDEGELASLQDLTNTLHLQDQVLFAGPLYGQEKLAAMRDADVLVLPAIHEIFGLVPFEALMCGTPVLVTEDSGLGQLIRDSGTGYLAPYGNALALAESLRHILENPEEARQKVAAGQRFIHDQLDWKKIVGELETLYQQCLH